MRYGNGSGKFCCLKKSFAKRGQYSVSLATRPQMAMSQVGGATYSFSQISGKPMATPNEGNRDKSYKSHGELSALRICVRLVPLVPPRFRQHPRSITLTNAHPVNK